MVLMFCIIKKSKGDKNKMERINVLMIDDNINLIGMVREYFKNSKNINICLEAHDGAEGIEVISNNLDAFDVIVLDLIMPNKDGIYVLNEMKKRGINKNVIVATSYNAPDVIREVSEHGVNYYILKPFALDDLEKRICDVMNKKTEGNKKNIEKYIIKNKANFTISIYIPFSILFNYNKFFIDYLLFFSYN